MNILRVGMCNLYCIQTSVGVSEWALAGITEGKTTGPTEVWF